MAIPTGWYPDPSDPTLERWWDGFSWTDQVRLLAVPNSLAPAAQTATSGSGGRWLLGGLLGLVLICVGALAFLFGSKKAEPSDTELAAAQRALTSTSAPTTTTTTTTTIAPTTTTAAPTTTAPPVIIYVPTPVPRSGSSTSRGSSGGTSAPTPYPSSFDSSWSPGPSGWTAQLASFAVADGPNPVNEKIANLSSQGIDAVTTWSGDWGSLSDGYWVVVATEQMYSGEDAISFCHRFDIYDRDNCFANIISQNAGDKSTELYP